LSKTVTNKKRVQYRKMTKEYGNVTLLSAAALLGNHPFKQENYKRSKQKTNFY